MRHILAQSSEIEDSDRFRELVKDPLVRLYLRDFSGETPEKLADMHKEREKVLRSAHDALKRTPDFKTLLSGTRLWGELLCNPFQPVLCKEPGSEQWVLTNDIEHHFPPSIRFRTVDHTTIQEAIDDKFGILENLQSGVKSAMFGACPCFLSVLYMPNGMPDQTFDIDSVAEVKLPRHTPRNVEGGVIFDKGEDYRYRLIAVVRIRPRSAQEHDYVRICDVEGNNILPLGDKSRYAGIKNDEWSISDQDRVCILFYVRLDRPVPEGGPPRIEEVHVEEPSQASENERTAAVIPEASSSGKGKPGNNTMTTPKTPGKLAPPPAAPNT